MEQEHRGGGRRYGRVALKRRVRVAIRSAGEWVPVTATAGDLSLSGFSLQVHEAVEPDSGVIASFRGTSDADEHVVYGTVRHCTFEGGEWMLLGVEFADPPEGLDLASVLRRFDARAA